MLTDGDVSEHFFIERKNRPSLTLPVREEKRPSPTLPVREGDLKKRNKTE